MNKLTLILIFLVVLFVSCSQNKCDSCGTWVGQFDNQKSATLIITVENSEKRNTNNNQPLFMSLYSGNDLVYKNSDEYKNDTLLHLSIKNIGKEAMFVELSKKWTRLKKDKDDIQKVDSLPRKKLRGGDIGDRIDEERLISKLLLLKENK